MGRRQYRNVVRGSQKEEQVMDLKDFIFFSYDADNAGSKIGLAVIHDDYSELQKISERILLGNQLIGRWARERGGIQYSSGGDQGVYAIPKQYEKELEVLRRDYNYATKLTVSIGVGDHLSESGQALLMAKLKGKDRVVKYNDKTKKEISIIRKRVKMGKFKSMAEYKVVESYLEKSEPSNLPMQYHVDFKGHKPTMHASGKYAQYHFTKEHLANILNDFPNQAEWSPRSPMSRGKSKEGFHPTAITRKQAPTPILDYLNKHPDASSGKKILYHGVGKDKPGAEAISRGGKHAVHTYDPFHSDPNVRQLPNDQFDEVHSHYTLNVVHPNVGKNILQEIHDRLKPGGKAVISVRRDLKGTMAKNEEIENEVMEKTIYSQSDLLKSDDGTGNELPIETPEDDCPYCEQTDGVDFDHCQYCHDSVTEEEPCQYCAEMPKEADCQYCNDQKTTEEPCQYCNDSSSTNMAEQDCAYCKDQEQSVQDDCTYCKDIPPLVSPDSNNSQAVEGSQEEKAQYESMGLNPPDIGKPPPPDQRPPIGLGPSTDVKIGPEKEEPNQELTNQRDVPPALQLDPEDNHSKEAMAYIAQQIEAQETPAGENTDSVGDEDLASGSEMEGNVSRPEGFSDQNNPTDMGQEGINQVESEPDYNSLLEEGLDHNADDINRQRAIQTVSQALTQFKAAKDSLEQLQGQVPELYQACVGILKAMIDMASLLGLGQGVASEPQSELGEVQGDMIPELTEQPSNEWSEPFPAHPDQGGAELKDGHAPPSGGGDDEGAIGQPIGKLPTSQTTKHVARTPMPIGAVNALGQKKIMDNQGKIRFINMKQGLVQGPSGAPIKPPKR